MPDDSHSPANGLTKQQADASRLLHGSNAMPQDSPGVFRQVVREVVTEPMFMLLVAACIIYFIAGEFREGIMMLVAILLVAGISLFQEYRSRNAIQALKKLSAPTARVFRDGQWQSIATDALVVDDLIEITEGEIVPADGFIVQANDLSLNESVLTGESLPVQKPSDSSNHVYKGTLVSAGAAQVKITAVGTASMLGKIGIAMQQVEAPKTPLQLQIRHFVRQMVWIGGLALALVVTISYTQHHQLMQAILNGLTMAMSVLPEEIPVAFSTFLALGALRLVQHNIIVKQPQYVETLGAATVICADKTGTITQNRMEIAWFYDAIANQSWEAGSDSTPPFTLLSYSMWASETDPFDPMEQAIHTWYARFASTDERREYKQVHEYPLSGTPPMMTHIFRNDHGNIIIAAKGGPEAILRHSLLTPKEASIIEKHAHNFAAKGMRVLGVGEGIWEGETFPVVQQDFTFRFLGLIAFYDPPKPDINATLTAFAQAGIQVKMITGDYPETAVSIAKEVGLNHHGSVISGTEVVALSDNALREKVQQTDIYARMYPEAKLRVIDALKGNGEIVAMTGDGVNDGPALKAAHIGIAMGDRGSEVARNAASLILTDDNLSHMVDAIALGRRIYDNLRKAIQYIVSIHIPIILIVLLPLVLGWKYANLFTPVHVIFLELIMGPTCSIIYENEPIEPGTMQRPPRIMGQTFLSGRKLLLSIIQGLVITIACLALGFYYMEHAGEAYVRSIIFVTLLFSNMLLTLVNRSFYFSVIETIRYRNILVPIIISITAGFILLLQWWTPLQTLFRVTPLSVGVLGVCAATAGIATLWMELWKIFLRKRFPNKVT